MIKKTKYLIIVLIISLFASKTIAQQGQTFYFMDRVSQATYFNPSVKSEYKTTLGGLLLPIVGQLPPPMYFNYSNNGFQYSDFIHHGTGDQSDSLVMDFDNLLENMRPTNYMHFQNHIDLLHVGLKTKNNDYMTFNITEKIDFGMSFPKDFVTLLWEGNKGFMDNNEKVDLSGFGFQFLHYREIAGGFTTEVMEGLTVGGRAKILFGMSNAQTKIDELSLYTDPEDYSITANADMSIQSNTPLDFNYYNDGDSINLDIDSTAIENYNAAQYLFNMSNPGFALDIGATYKINDDFTAYFSVNDLGFISWNDNPFTLSSDGVFRFQGIEVDFFEDEEEFNENMDNFGDSVLNIFSPNDDNNSYITWLPTDVYFGGQYHFHELLDFGALYRMEFYRKNLFNSFTLSANSDLTDWFSAHLSYSMMNNKYSNLGFGFTIRGAFLQYYFVTDNIISPFMPQNARNFNFRMGCNLVLGYKQVKSESLF